MKRLWRHSVGLSLGLLAAGELLPPPASAQTFIVRSGEVRIAPAPPGPMAVPPPGQLIATSAPAASPTSPPRASLGTPMASLGQPVARYSPPAPPALTPIADPN